jgi:hypothetical protein
VATATCRSLISRVLMSLSSSKFGFGLAGAQLGVTPLRVVATST